MKLYTTAKVIIFLCVLLSAINIQAQTVSDSITAEKPSRRLLKCTYVGVPFLVGSAIISTIDKDIRDARNRGAGSFHTEVDTYLEYVPMVTYWTIKLSGVKGKHSRRQQLVNNIISTAIMNGVAQGLKHGITTPRPDESDTHSFPSGHTAVAFMGATILNKEYGHISPWIGVGAYTTATATGVLRVMNNKHWASDVLAGAGIGILSAEFGYWLGDIIFKNKGNNTKTAENLNGY